MPEKKKSQIVKDILDGNSLAGFVISSLWIRNWLAPPAGSFSSKSKLSYAIKLK